MPIETVWMGSLYENGERLDNPPLTDGTGWEVGWVFHWGFGLSKHYLEHVKPIREPITVMLPMRNSTGWKTPDGVHPVNFCIDSFPTSDPDACRDVTVDLDSLIIGQRPDITVAPSINCVGLYHGFLQGGVLTDDLGD